MNPAQGKLIGIATRSHSRAPMVEVEFAEITEACGVLNDSRGAPGKRQVTVLAAEDWAAACEVVGKELPWTHRRANLLVEGLQLKNSTGSIIVVGEVRLEVTGETDPCSRMDQIEPGLQAALAPDWRGGVCCRVLRGGEIATGTSLARWQDSMGTDRTTTIADLKSVISTFVRERDWEQFHDPKNLVMAMVSEVGELVEHFRWVRSEDALNTAVDKENAEAIAHELADILMFALEFANVCEIDIAAAIASKLEINRQRYPIERAKGRSEKYDRLSGLDDPDG